MIKYMVTAGILALSISSASAGCSGYGATTYCSDGNTYTKIGNTTYGSNNRTGSTWSQTTVGGSTFGTDASGNGWSTYGRR